MHTSGTYVYACLCVGAGDEKHLLKEKLVSAEREGLAWATQVDRARSSGGASPRTSA